MGDGVHVKGNGNRLERNDVFASGGDGIEVIGDDNQLEKNNLGERDKGNTGDGVHVVGAGSYLEENDAFSNNGDGFDVSGGLSSNPNVLKKNRAGDRSGKGNGGNGFLIGDLVGDQGDGVGHELEIQENTAKSNGLNGFKVYGTGHELKKNTSGGSSSADKNGVCAFHVANGNFNAQGQQS